jgi:hypothetical protein
LEQNGFVIEADGKAILQKAELVGGYSGKAASSQSSWKTPDQQQQQQQQQYQQQQYQQQPRQNQFQPHQQVQKQPHTSTKPSFSDFPGSEDSESIISGFEEEELLPLDYDDMNNKKFALLSKIGR